VRNNKSFIARMPLALRADTAFPAVRVVFCLTEEIFMTTFSYTITDPLGIHARPAGLFIKKLEEFKSTITISRDDTGEFCKGGKLFALMKLRIKKGMTITVKAEGEDESAAIEAAQSFLTTHL
jgi:phosphotransferase system HPr (HPr) family protein